MPVTAAELQRYGHSSIDVYMRNNPIDAVNAERPFLASLMKIKKTCTGGKDKLVVSIRKGNDSNIQNFYGSEQVSYKRKDTLNSAKFDYVNFHDGFTLHEDDFIRNGVTVTEGGPKGRVTASEKETIVNLFEEQNETLRQGFEEGLDLALHTGNGTNLSALATNLTSSEVFGLSDMVSVTPTTGTYGSINRANETYWQNFAQNGVTFDNNLTTGVLTVMRQMWRACTKYGGMPNKILVGSEFYDGYVDYMQQQFGRVNYGPVSKKGIEGSEGAVYYQGVPVEWDPTFDTLEDNSIDTVANWSWKKRCYFINTRHLIHKPIKGQDMVSRNPPRVYNKYEYYWALTTRFYLGNQKPRAHGVISA